MKTLLVLFTSFLSTPALAYVDPGTGSLMIQGILALIAAASVALRKYWYKVKSLFRSKDATSSEESRDI